jgi:hypothetical protein
MGHARLPRITVHAFRIRVVKNTLCDGVAPTIALSAHAPDKLVLRQIENSLKFGTVDHAK